MALLFRHVFVNPVRPTQEDKSKRYYNYQALRKIEYMYIQTYKASRAYSAILLLGSTLLRADAISNTEP